MWTVWLWLAAIAPVPGQVDVEIAVSNGAAVELHTRMAGVEVQRYRPDRVINERAKVCDAPCRRTVDVSLGPTFFVVGPSISRSRDFTLPPYGSARIAVRPGSRAMFVSGWVLASVGAASMLAGATVLLLSDDQPRRQTAGGITLGAGVPLLVGGALMVRFGRTRVEVVPLTVVR